MLIATFILTKSRTKTLSYKGKVGEEIDGVRRRVPIQKTIHQVHMTLRGGCTAISNLMEQGTFVRQGHT